MIIDGKTIHTNLCKDIINMFNIETILEKWKQHDYKFKPLLIYGRPGCCKSIFSKYILNDYSIITIDINFCKSKKDFNEIINLSLYKKDVEMMFSDKTYKSLLIDDIDYIIQNEKKTAKQIINFIKKIKHSNKFPIILCGNFKYENIRYEKIYDYCIPIHMNFTHENIKCLTNKYFINDCMKQLNIDTLIKKSNYNFHNIKTNIEFHKDYNNIELYEKKIINTDCMGQLLSNTMVENFRFITCDSIIIGFNILENLIKYNMENLEYIDKIYEYNCIGDSFSCIINNNINEHYEYLKLYHIIIPLFYVKQLNYTFTNMNYNKYISRSIIYTHNQNLLNKSSINYKIIMELYGLIETYSKETDFIKKSEKLYSIKQYIFINNISEKIYHKFIKYYEWLYHFTIKKELSKLFF
jgi:hypothetical protein